MHLFHRWKLIDFDAINWSNIDKEEVAVRGYQCSICGKRKVKFTDERIAVRDTVNGKSCRSIPLKNHPTYVQWAMNFMNYKSTT